MKDAKIELRQSLNREQAASWLEGLARCLRGGGVCLKSGEDILESIVPDVVLAEVETRRKKGVFRFSLEMSWPEQPAEAADLDISPVDGPIPQGPGRAQRAVGARDARDQAPPPVARPRGDVARTSPKEGADEK